MNFYRKSSKCDETEDLPSIVDVIVASFMEKLFLEFPPSILSSFNNETQTHSTQIRHFYLHSLIDKSISIYQSKS